MIQCMLAAPHSGSGKTAVTTALLAVLDRRGLTPCAFKCGPDFIDPMFHRAVLGLDSHNLDLFLSDEETVKGLYGRYAVGHGSAVTEGVMGFYDGLGGTTTHSSSWHLAHTLDLPVLLVIRPKGASLTLAAQIRGIARFREPGHIAGVILNDCSAALFRMLAPTLEDETGIPVLGHLPHMDAADFPSRHLGLYTARELTDWKTRIAAMAEAMEQSVDVDRLLALCDRPAPAVPPLPDRSAARVPIAVARDEAFCFTYAESLDALADCGADLFFFSPIRDKKLPAGIGGLYLPGGYPELYTRALSGNTDMRQAIRSAVAGGLPTVAECGGFLYLGQTLSDPEGAAFPMVNLFPGAGTSAGKLVRFGYARMTARTDSLLFRAEEPVPVHAFHHWDTTANGTDLTLTKPLTGRSWCEGYATDTLFAGFPHLYLAGSPHLARRFVCAAREFLAKEDAL